ncbi:hypothetical protein [Nocardia flavorosea]|uniref:Lipoprotein n=1 Tax=Nocardia flavorosea TaxID=53429 RepID=A0A846YTF2_9NOCA|nr:hypothetical protein [Nocardia flavorosea]NKY60941.1 hypothetical protein [Nocardia flavorosea]
MARAGSKAFQALPTPVQLVLLAAALLAGMVGCSAAWVDQQSYVPAPNICRAHETWRTDCVQVQRPAPPVQQAEVVR